MVTESAVHSHNVAKEVVLVSERKGHILPVHLEPTTIPPSLKYPLAGIQHIEYFNGDPEQNLKAILRSLERTGVSITPPQDVEGDYTDEGARARPPADSSRLTRAAEHWPCCRLTTSVRTRRPTTSATG